MTLGKRIAMMSAVQPGTTQLSVSNLAPSTHRMPSNAMPALKIPSMIASFSGFTENEIMPSDAKRTILRSGYF